MDDYRYSPQPPIPTAPLSQFICIQLLNVTVLCVFGPDVFDTITETSEYILLSFGISGDTLKCYIQPAQPTASGNISCVIIPCT